MKSNWLYKLCQTSYNSDDEEDQIQLEAAWSLFYDRFPNLRKKDTLWNAEHYKVLTLEEYEAIFTGYAWEDGYGGSRWYDIAKSWYESDQMIQSGYGVDWNSAMILIDHIFDLAHNTGSLFTKASEDIQKWLLSALEIKKNNEFHSLLKYVSSDVRRLALKYMRYTGVSVEWYQNWEKQRQQNIHKVIDAITKSLKWNDQFPGSQGSNFQVKPLKEFIDGYDLSVNDFIGTSVYDWIVLIDNQDQRLMNVLLSIVAYKEPSLTTYLSSYSEEWFKLLSSNPGVYSSMMNIITNNVNHEDIRSAVNTIETLNNIPGVPSNIVLEDIKNRLSNNVKTAALTKPMFFDFYVLTVIDSSVLPQDEAKEVDFLKKYYAHNILLSLNSLLKSAVLSEAAHVGDHFATSLIENLNEYISELDANDQDLLVDDTDELYEYDPSDTMDDETGTLNDTQIRERAGY